MRAIEEQSPHRQAGSALPDLPLGAQERTVIRETEAGSFSLCLLAPTEGHQETALLGVSGELDLVTTPALRDALLPVLERGSGDVVVDLSEVRFIDSSGVHLLLNTLRRLGSENRRLAVACREHGPVHRVLALVGLLGAMTVHRSRHDALIGGEDRIRSHPSARRARRQCASRRPASGSSYTALRPRGG